MSEIQLTVSEREGLGKGVSRQLRAKGLIPAILYGRKMKPRLLTVNPRELYKAVSTDQGLNALIHLKIAGQSEKAEKDNSTTVLVKDLQVDPIERTYVHADFMQVGLEDEVRVFIPVVLVGKSAGQKEGGIIQQVKRDLEVYCRANAIPKVLEVDITSLEIGDSLHLDAIKLPAGVRSAVTIDITIAACVPPEKEEVVAPVAAEVAAVPGAEGAAAPGAAPGAPGAAPAGATPAGGAPAAGAPAAAAAGGKAPAKEGGKKGGKSENKGGRGT